MGRGREEEVGRGGSTFDITPRNEDFDDYLARSGDRDGDVVDCGVEIGEGVDYDFFHDGAKSRDVAYI